MVKMGNKKTKRLSNVELKAKENRKGKIVKKKTSNGI